MHCVQPSLDFDQLTNRKKIIKCQCERRTELHNKIVSVVNKPGDTFPMLQFSWQHKKPRIRFEKVLTKIRTVAG